MNLQEYLVGKADLTMWSQSCCFRTTLPPYPVRTSSNAPAPGLGTDMTVTVSKVWKDFKPIHSPTVNWLEGFPNHAGHPPGEIGERYRPANTRGP